MECQFGMVADDNGDLGQFMVNSGAMEGQWHP